MGKMPKDGCHGEQEWVEGLVTECCPVMYQPEYNTMFQMYYWAEKGFMPYKGGWAEQPAGVITGLQVMFEEHARQQAAVDKAAVRKAEQHT